MKKVLALVLALCLVLAAAPSFALELLSAQVSRDVHKMHAYVRFTPVREEDGLIVAGA